MNRHYLTKYIRWNSTKRATAIKARKYEEAVARKLKRLVNVNFVKE